MRSEYLGAAIVPDGFLGATIQVHLCYDPESLHTIGVWTGGTFTTEIPPALSATEALWLIAHHPICKRYQS